MVHGRGTRRQEGLRAVDAVRAAGWDSLLVSWRNDGEAPESADRRYGLGGTEWPDVDAAIAYARAHGARRIVLLGWSMGGAISVQTVLHSAEARDTVEGLILDSPAVDWSDILRFQGGEIGLPERFAGVVGDVLRSSRLLGLTGAEAPIDLDALDAAAAADGLVAPVLVLHSVDDGFVPIDGSRRLAAARPDLVRLDEWAGARHTKLWNQDPERWEREVVGWLDALPPRD
nr:alpha/beta fold hydrolase [Agromyces seonyuensis]